MSAIAGTVAATSHVLERRRSFPGSGGSRRHTIPDAFATSIPATRSCRSW